MTAKVEHPEWYDKCPLCTRLKMKRAKTCINCRDGVRPIIIQPQGVGYRLISLTQGQMAKVSIHRYEELNRFRWFAWWNKDTKSYYAMRNTPAVDGKRSAPYTVPMHRQILGLQYRDGKLGDHENTDTLDNQDSNLRIVSSSQNRMNSRIGDRNKVNLKGVSWSEKMGAWQAQIGVDRKHIHLGFFDTPENAHAKYCEAVKKYHGKHGRITGKVGQV